ncbi:hypothetical protein [Flavobacterium sp. WV_118_3]|jgi:hypothetical protein|uniref:hypothetical protein n=1 Tax=Flavobacterium sp. WV_118_3 TaxID=3151764 RepID=UPI00321B4750
MKRVLIIIVSLVVLSCTDKKDIPIPENAITAKCEKIIISDSFDFPIPAINFIISFKNNSNQEIKLFNNTLRKSDAYFQAGVLLKSSETVTPIGAFGISNYLRLKPYSKTAYIFSYSKQHPGKWLIANRTGRKALLDFTNKVTLNYHYEEKINEYLAKTKNKNDRENSMRTKDLNYSFQAGKDFTILKDNPLIEFDNILNIDTLMKTCRQYEQK